MGSDYITVKLFRKSHSKALRHLKKNGGGIADLYARALTLFLEKEKQRITQTIPSTESNIVSSTDKLLK